MQTSKGQRLCLALAATFASTCITYFAAAACDKEWEDTPVPNAFCDDSDYCRAEPLCPNPSGECDSCSRNSYQGECHTQMDVHCQHGYEPGGSANCGCAYKREGNCIGSACQSFVSIENPCDGEICLTIAE